MAARLKVQFLLPLKYNDKTDVEHEKLFQTRNEVVNSFGGITIHPLSTEGLWKCPKTDKIYFDICKRFEISIDKTRDVDMVLKKLKETLKKRFRQEEIYMIYYEITQV